MQLEPDQAPDGRLISLTPLIDVVFILLIFFMLASSFLDWRAVDLKLSGDAAAGAASDRTLVLTLESGGGLGLEGASLEPAAALERVSERLAGRPDLAIVLRPQPGVVLQRVVDLMDSLKTLGARDIALAREP